MRKAGNAGNTPALQQLILAAGLSTLVLVFISQDWLWRWDLLLYDAAASIESAAAPPDLIIVAIDDESLSRIGRWPWPRSVHAQLVRRLHADGAKVIGLDILFVEPDSRDPQGDAALAAAIADSARTVLPVVMELPRFGGQPLELLPAPAFAEGAHTLAHVHVELDRDGLARSVYLRAGVGDPHWLVFAEAILRLADPQRGAELPGQRAPPGAATSTLESTLAWTRDYHVLVPFRGPPGTIKQISYARVLNGEYVQGSFADKVVMVGATATGMADNLATPVSGHGVPMPGVEFHANVFAALRDGTTVSLLSTSLRACISVLVVLLLLLLYPRLTPRRGLLAAITFVGVLVVASAALLVFARIWFAPAPVLVALILSYPLWSWLRLEFAMRFLAQEFARLQREQVNVAAGARPDLGDGLGFLHALLPVGGYVVVDPHGVALQSVGQAPTQRAAGLVANQWVAVDDELWTAVEQPGGLWSVGLSWQHACGPTAAEQRLLDAAIRMERRHTKRQPTSRIEVVQARVFEIQHASARLRTLRGVIDNTLEQMQHGMILIDLLGRIQLANQQAAKFVLADANAKLLGRNILHALAELTHQSAVDWPTTLTQVLVKRESVHLACRHADGRDLLGHAAPMLDDSARVIGAIFNLADVSALRQSERRRAEMLNFVSHDLRSPLISIIALSELAAQSGAAGAGNGDDNDNRDHDAERALQRGEALRRAGEHARRTLALAEQFLELARVQGDEELAADEVDLMMVAMDALDSIWPQAEAKSIELDPRIEVDEARVTGDAALLGRVLVNLLTNAVKYSPAGASVGIELTRRGAEICCCVFDTGYGIAPQDLERLFGSYQRIERQEHAGERGIGLGLAFVDATVKRHGGRIEVDSEFNKGSRFSVLLPIAMASGNGP